MKTAFISLGCPKNQVDLEALIGTLRQAGHEIVNDAENCDALIINTCGFIEPAVSEAIDTILEMAGKLKSGAKLIVTGCMPERYSEDFASEFPEVDFYTGVGTLGDVVDYLDGKEPSETRDFLENKDRIIVNAPYYAYLKISEGCNNRCSYCTIPSIRGPLQSRPMEDIVKEAKSLIDSGVQEIILISQDNTKYGLDLYKQQSLVELIQQIEEIEGDFYIRLMYLNPDGISTELVDVVSASEKILSYYDIPLQHISRKILKSMNRKSGPGVIKEVYEYIRYKDPDAVIRSTFITGYPGEKEEDHRELKNFIKEYRPDYAGFFPYSPEEDTVAALLEGRVKEETAARRLRELQNIQQCITLAWLKKLKKNEIIAFVEKVDEDFEFMLTGRALFQAPEIDGQVYITDGTATKGYGPYRCKIETIDYPDLYCRIEGPLRKE